MFTLFALPLSLLINYDHHRFHLVKHTHTLRKTFNANSFPFSWTFGAHTQGLLLQCLAPSSPRLDSVQPVQISMSMCVFV